MSSSATQQQSDQLNAIFNGLKSRSPDTRIQAADDLKRYVSSVSRAVNAWD
jgi:FKBP12-rapamycin complex-associated protein